MSPPSADRTSGGQTVNSQRLEQTQAAWNPGVPSPERSINTSAPGLATAALSPPAASPAREPPPTLQRPALASPLPPPSSSPSQTTPSATQEDFGKAATLTIATTRTEAPPTVPGPAKATVLGTPATSTTETSAAGQEYKDDAGGVAVRQFDPFGMYVRTVLDGLAPNSAAVEAAAVAAEAPVAAAVGTAGERDGSGSSSPPSRDDDTACGPDSPSPSLPETRHSGGGGAVAAAVGAGGGGGGGRLHDGSYPSEATAYHRLSGTPEAMGAAPAGTRVSSSTGAAVRQAPMASPMAFRGLSASGSGRSRGPSWSASDPAPSPCGPMVDAAEVSTAPPPQRPGTPPSSSEPPFAAGAAAGSMMPVREHSNGGSAAAAAATELGPGAGPDGLSPVGSVRKPLGVTSPSAVAAAAAAVGVSADTTAVLQHVPIPRQTAAQQEYRRRSSNVTSGGGSGGGSRPAGGVSGGGGGTGSGWLTAAAVPFQSWLQQQTVAAQHQHQHQQQGNAAAAAVAAAALPLLAMPTAAIPYKPWGPVMSAVQPPAAADPAAAAAAAAAPHLSAAMAAVTAAAAASMPTSPPPAAQPPAVAAAPSVAVTSAAGCGSGPHGVSSPEDGAAAALAGQVRLAEVLREAGKAAEALTILEALMLRAPGHVGALYGRAQCLQALGQVQPAIATLLRLISLSPTHTPSLVALGCLYQAQGLLGEAVAAYRRAAELAPGDVAIREGLAVVLTDQGTKLKNAGAPLSEAVARYQAAAALCPRYAPALYNLGVVAGELGQGEAAAEYYRAAIAAEPRYAQAHCNLGVLLRERGRLPEAVAAYEAALAAAPNFTIVRNNLAIALTDLGTHVKNEGRLEEGIAMYERALSYAPRHADALYNLGVAYGEKGDLQRAAFMYEMALAFNPGCAEAHNNLGVIWKEQDNIEKAIECYSAALAIRPNFPQSLNNLGVVMTAQGRAAEALTLLAAAVAASPSYIEAHNNLGVLQRDVGCISDALASYSRCLELDPNCRNAGQNRLLALNYVYPGEEELVCAAHRQWGQRFRASLQPLPPLGPGERSWDPERPLRIGYISPDLFTHSVSYFAEAPLTHHSPACGYQHYVYSCVPKPDAKTVRLRLAVESAGGVWREAVRLGEGELAELVRADEIDLLVELTGHTANNRLGVMAHRPAPVQLTWIGYPNSTGLAAVDYRITDDICDPLDTKQTFVEQLVRLPGCFLCYTPAMDAPPVVPPPALTNGFVTFGSFNNLAKITPQVLRLWGAILFAVPGSRLVLKNKPFACEAARAHVSQQLAAVGVEAWRVDLLPLAPGNSQHLATYGLMDISLDPFPYAGTTTTTESLYMGVPVLTLAGSCHAHNVGVSLLTAVGLHPPPQPHPLSTSTTTPTVSGAHQAPISTATTTTITKTLSSPTVSTAATASTPGNNTLSAPPNSNGISSGAVSRPDDDVACVGVSGSGGGGGDVQISVDGAGAAAGGGPGVLGSGVAGGRCVGGSGCGAAGSVGGGGCRGWVAYSEEEYVALAVAHAADVQGLTELRASLRSRMLSSPMCDGPAFVGRLEGVYRGLWRRHCALMNGDKASADAAAGSVGLRQPAGTLKSAF